MSLETRLQGKFNPRATLPTRSSSSHGHSSPKQSSQPSLLQSIRTCDPLLGPLQCLLESIALRLQYPVKAEIWQMFSLKIAPIFNFWVILSLGWQTFLAELETYHGPVAYDKRRRPAGYFHNDVASVAMAEAPPGKNRWLLDRARS